MEEKEHQFLIVGLPEAGKTSFIHAVDDLIHGPPSGDALRSCGLALDRSYLERDKGRFRAGKKLEHTERNLQGPMPELWFEHQATNRKGRLFLPDVSGEIFQDQWIDRKWGTAFRESISNIGGMLVFVGRTCQPAPRSCWVRWQLCRLQGTKDHHGTVKEQALKSNLWMSFNLSH